MRSTLVTDVTNGKANRGGKNGKAGQREMGDDEDNVPQSFAVNGRGRTAADGGAVGSRKDCGSRGESATHLDIDGSESVEEGTLDAGERGGNC